MTKTATFMMGLPAAGKSTYVRENLESETNVVIDCDRIKESHEDYDPKNPGALHVWSKNITNLMLATQIAEGGDFIYDGTGTNHAALIKVIRQAEEAGYFTKLIFVTVPLNVSLERNAKRERVVPEHIVREKAEAIEIAFEIVAKEVDECHAIDNSATR